MTFQHGRRWERRLEQLLSLERDPAEEAPLGQRTVINVRRLLNRLEDAGADTSTLRLFLPDDGSITIRAQKGAVSRTVEILEDEFTLRDVNLTEGTAEERHVAGVKAAVEALALV